MKYVDKNPGCRWIDIHKNLNLDDREKEALNRAQVSEKLFLESLVDKEPRLYLSANSTFQLLEYEELKFAREDSKNARMWAIIALCVSIFLAVASVVVSLWVASQIADVNVVSSVPLEVISNFS